MIATCPVCHVEIVGDATGDLTPAARPRNPRPGDVAICWACRAIAVVALDGRQLVVPTPAQLAAIEPPVRAVLDALQLLRGHA